MDNTGDANGGDEVKTSPNKKEVVATTTDMETMTDDVVPTSPTSKTELSLVSQNDGIPEEETATTTSSPNVPPSSSSSTSSSPTTTPNGKTHDVVLDQPQQEKQVKELNTTTPATTSKTNTGTPDTTTNGSNKANRKRLMLIVSVVALMLCAGAVVGVIFGLQEASERRKDKNNAAVSDGENVANDVPTFPPSLDSNNDVVPQPTFLMGAATTTASPTTMATVTTTMEPTLIPTTSSPTVNRKQQIIDYMIQQNVSLSTELELVDSPQSLAVEFLANLDAMQFSIPTTTSDKGTSYGYKFITRYVMALFYYAMNGTTWYYDLNFLTQQDICDWFFVFAEPVGQVGIICNPTTEQIVGLSFSK